MLVDSVGRGVTDIRISVTKRCNFGCIYCHDEGLGPVAKPRTPHGEEMTPTEVDRLVRVARGFDIDSVKFTGGGPSSERTSRRSSHGPCGTSTMSPSPRTVRCWKDGPRPYAMPG